MSETGDPQGANSISIEKLTKADLPRTVIHLAWPVVLEMTFFGLGGIINTILVGRLGASALAAVGLGQQIEFMIQVAFAAVTVGATAMISRHVKEGVKSALDSFFNFIQQNRRESEGPKLMQIISI